MFSANLGDEIRDSVLISETHKHCIELCLETQEEYFNNYCDNILSLIIHKRHKFPF